MFNVKGWHMSIHSDAVAQAESGVSPCLEGCCRSSKSGPSPHPDLHFCWCRVEEDHAGFLWGSPCPGAGRGSPVLLGPPGAPVRLQTLGQWPPPTTLA